MGFDIRVKIKIRLNMHVVIEYLAQQYPYNGAVNAHTFDWHKPRRITMNGLAPVEIGPVVTHTDYSSDEEEEDYQPDPEREGSKDFPQILRLMRDHVEYLPKCLEFFNHDGCLAVTEGSGFQWVLEENEVHIVVGTYFSYKGSDPLDIDYEMVSSLLDEWSEIDPEAVTLTTCSVSV